MKHVAVATMMCLLLAGSAGATQITAQFVSAAPGLNVTVYYPTNQADYTIAGIYKFDQVGTPNALLPDVFPAFCIDLKQNIWFGGQYTWTVMEPANNAPVPGIDGLPMSASQQLELQKLFGAYYTGAVTVGDDPAHNDNVEAAAFQAAVWELVWESQSNGHNVAYGNGSVYMNSGWAATARANEMLTGLATFAGPLPVLQALVNSSYQDQIVLLPGQYMPQPEPPTNAVPEPMTMAGVLLGVGSLVRYLRKRRTA